MREDNEYKITIGADPELFLRDKKTGKFVSAHGKIPGTKQEPHPVEYGAVQVDGNAVEFNIHPASTAKQFLKHINAVRKQLEEMLPEFDLVATPAVIFDEDVWSALPDEAKELGCDPDFNAYTGAKNELPPPEVVGRLRTAAGHIHVGWTSGEDVTDVSHLEGCTILVKELDKFVGMPLTMASLNPKEVLRRTLYGNFGAFRPKPYGVEYRSPSNFWLTDDDAILWVFSQTKKVFNDLLAGKYHAQDKHLQPNSVVESMNTVSFESRLRAPRALSGMLRSPYLPCPSLARVLKDRQENFSKEMSRATDFTLQSCPETTQLRTHVEMLRTAISV